MTTYATNAATRPANPLLGRIKTRLTTITSSLEFRVLSVLAMVLMLWGAAIATFGYVAFISVVLALVPAMFVVLILITVGK